MSKQMKETNNKSIANAVGADTYNRVSKDERKGRRRKIKKMDTIFGGSRGGGNKEDGRERKRNKRSNRSTRRNKQ